MTSLAINCWLCGNDTGIVQPSEILSLPDLIRCERCNANQGRIPEVKQLSLFGGES